ncbi:MAG: thiamine-phosphate synthase family protein [Nitrososphaeria archaeon]
MPEGKIRINNNNLDASSVLDDLMASAAPAIGLPLQTLPFFALSYAIGNLLSSFAEPYSITDTITLPPHDCEKAESVYKNLKDMAAYFDVRVAGGHTGCYEGVELPVITVTAHGKRVRKSGMPLAGDSVLLIGEPFLESNWLRWLVGESEIDIDWKQLTPVHILRDVLKIDEVKVAHDVSEGGIGGAIVELQERYGMNITLDDKKFATKLDEPSYGTVLAVTGNVDSVCEKLMGLGHKCHKLASFGGASPLAVHATSELWDFYGKPSSTFDRSLNGFSLFLKRLSKIDLNKVVPEVGMNIAYFTHEGIIGIDGRIVRTIDGVRIGNARYGASRHVGYILSELRKNGAKYTAAANIRLSDNALKMLIKMGMSVQEVNTDDPYCPPLKMIRETGVIADVYIEKPSIGMEGGMVVLTDDLNKMLMIIKNLSTL